jgi:hypothetical protein
MAICPISPPVALMEWSRAYGSVITAHAEQIGLTPAQAAGFKSATDAAGGAILAQERARQAAEAATRAAESAVAALRATASDTVRLVRAFAKNSDTPDLVYQTAQIPPPATPSPAPPLAQPSQPAVTLDASTGGLTLRWKASNLVPGHHRQQEIRE